MNTLFKMPAPRLLLAAGLTFGAVAAQAASGFTVSPDQEQRVSVGMSQAEVLQALGRPSLNQHFMNEPGLTWTYNVPANIQHHTLFDVDFTADGKVASVSERIIDDE
jgi:outer membrane protein assembly factor BamE (lipoprotein component of BamABCDE complex)